MVSVNCVKKQFAAEFSVPTSPQWCRTLLQSSVPNDNCSLVGHVQIPLGVCSQHAPEC